MLHRTLLALFIPFLSLHPANAQHPHHRTGGRRRSRRCISHDGGESDRAIGVDIAMESVSATVPITIAKFALSSPGTTAAVGSAAIAAVTVNVANNYSNPLAFSCTLPASLAESARFVNPKSLTGTGPVSLTVNTTPAHPLSGMRMSPPAWFAAGGGASFAGMVLLVFPGRRRRALAALLLSLVAVVFTVIGCGNGARTDPGTAKGAYMVVVTATANNGSTQDQASVNVPITIQ